MKRLEGKVAVVTGGNSGMDWQLPGDCVKRAPVLLFQGVT